MDIWKVTKNRPEKVAKTNLKYEQVLEENLENWIFDEPAMLGEPLLILGRQVLIPDMKDRLDLLALDPQGNAVIIELKRGKLKDPVDMQAMRYASYISKWTYEDFESLAAQNRKSRKDFNFNTLFEEFCAENGVDEIPDLNSDQRMIIVGSEVKEKLGTVALWLLDHHIDIKVIEVEMFKEGTELLVQPQVIIPLPISRFSGTGARQTHSGTEPWLSDGRNWHLEKRCSAVTKSLVERLDEVIQSNLEVDGPRWDQKFYFSYRLRGFNWLIVGTHSTLLYLDIHVKRNSFKQSTLAKKLQLPEYVSEVNLSDKMGMPSSIAVRSRNESMDTITIRIKADFDPSKPEFIDLLKKAYDASPK